MPLIDDRSIDMILCDLPYGITCCKWDSIIPLNKLWKQYKRIIKDNGAIILTSRQPFTSKLVMSNLKMFRYEIIWEKDSPTNPLVAKKRIMPRHENILIFYKNQCIFNPQMIIRQNKNKRNNIKNTSHFTETKGNTILFKTISGQNNLTYPHSIQKFTRSKRNLHPTQKPIELFKYLIKTYSNENDLVLDNCIGSGTTAIACIETNRNYIGTEKNKVYFEIAVKRTKHIQIPLTNNCRAVL